MISFYKNLRRLRHSDIGKGCPFSTWHFSALYRGLQILQVIKLFTLAACERGKNLPLGRTSIFSHILFSISRTGQQIWRLVLISLYKQESASLKQTFADHFPPIHPTPVLGVMFCDSLTGKKLKCSKWLLYSVKHNAK